MRIDHPRPASRAYARGARRAFLAGARIAHHYGRSGTPNDQAWIESLFGHVKTEHPRLEKIKDPGELERELDRVQLFHNTVRLHQGIGYVTPTTNITAAARRSAPPAEPDSPAPTKPGLPTGDT